MSGGIAGRAGPPWATGSALTTSKASGTKPTVSLARWTFVIVSTVRIGRRSCPAESRQPPTPPGSSRTAWIGTVVSVLGGRRRNDRRRPIIAPFGLKRTENHRKTTTEHTEVTERKLPGKTSVVSVVSVVAVKLRAPLFSSWLSQLDERLPLLVEALGAVAGESLHGRGDRRLVEVRFGDHVGFEPAAQPLVVPVRGERVFVGLRADVAQRPHPPRAAGD